MIKKIIRKLKISPWTIKYNESVKKAYCCGTVTNNTIAGKTVCISGATGDIGDAMLRRFIAEKCNIVAIGRSSSKLEDVKKKYGNVSEIITLQINLEDEKCVRDIFGKYAKENRIDILINNAGIFGGAREKRFRNVTEEELLKTLIINTKSAELLSQIVIDNHKNEELTIINISSICSRFNSFRYSPYGISKSALVGLTNDINKKYKNKKIFARCILPGSVATKMGNIKLGDNIVGNNNILNRPALPEEISALAAIYSSDIGKYCVNNIVASAQERL